MAPSPIAVLEGCPQRVASSDASEFRRFGLGRPNATSRGGLSHPNHWESPIRKILDSLFHLDESEPILAAQGEFQCQPVSTVEIDQLAVLAYLGSTSSYFPAQKSPARLERVSAGPGAGFLQERPESTERP